MRQATGGQKFGLGCVYGYPQYQKSQINSVYDPNSESLHLALRICQI